MIKSFLNILLPDDEYKRMRILYFMAEALFLSVLILLVVGFMKNMGSFWDANLEVLLLLGPFIAMTYVYMRYIFTGIEFTETTDRKSYKNQLRKIVIRACSFGGLFFLLYFIPFGYRKEGWGALGLVGLVIFFYILFDYISLKQSYKKNKKLDE